MNEKAKESVGVVAVIRANNTKDALRMSEACILGGLTNIEGTFTTPEADIAIKRLIFEYGDQVVNGAGTVLDPITA